MTTTYRIETSTRRTPAMVQDIEARDMDEAVNVARTRYAIEHALPVDARQTTTARRLVL